MVTATNLASYLYCPRKLFISSVLLVEEAPKEELVKGKIWHETYENMNNSEEKIVCSIRSKDYQEIFDVYRKSYSKILRDTIIKNKSSLCDFKIALTDVFADYWPHFEEEAKEHALNLSGFIQKNNVFGKELWDSLTPKILAEQYFKSERLNLSGVVDVLEIHELDGKKVFVPIELKTGKFPTKGMWDGHRIQLAAYMLLLEDSGKIVNDAVIKYKGCERRILQMNSFLKEEVLDLIDKTSKLLNSSELPKIPAHPGKCSKCQMKELCYDETGLRKRLEEVKSGLKKT